MMLWSEVVAGFWYAGVAQLVERQLPKLNVASSNLVSRSIYSEVSFTSFLRECPLRVEKPDWCICYFGEVNGAVGFW